MLTYTSGPPLSQTELNGAPRNGHGRKTLDSFKGLLLEDSGGCTSSLFVPFKEKNSGSIHSQPR